MNSEKKTEGKRVKKKGPDRRTASGIRLVGKGWAVLTVMEERPREGLGERRRGGNEHREKMGRGKGEHKKTVAARKIRLIGENPWAREGRRRCLPDGEGGGRTQKGNFTSSEKENEDVRRAWR